MLQMKTLTLVGAAIVTLVPAHAAKPAQKTPAKKPAAAKKAPAPKPPPPKPAAGPIVMGTKQLPGDFGKFGTTYTIGKERPLNFTLKSVEYRLDRFNVDDNSWGYEAGQKQLVLRYTVQNPTKEEQTADWGSFTFTAVDSQDVNHENIQAVARDGDPKNASVFVNLKPAQKLEMVAAIILPAERSAPKLIVQREEGSPVVRYDLRGKIKPLQAPFADPSDKTGATALARVPAEAGAFYPLGLFDVRLDSTTFTADAVNGEAPEEGKRHFVAAVTVKNATGVEQNSYWGTFEPHLVDADGETVEYNQVMLKASRDEPADGVVQPASEARVRFFFAVPSDLGVKSLGLKEGYSRTLIFDLAAASS